MLEAVATRSFTRSDTREAVRAGNVIYGEADYVKDLCRVGLAKVVPEIKMISSAPSNKRRPLQAAGEDTQLSVSPAAQALPQTRSKKSGGGGRKKKKDDV